MGRTKFFDFMDVGKYRHNVFQERAKQSKFKVGIIVKVSKNTY